MHETTSRTIHEVIARYNTAFRLRDPTLLEDLISDDHGSLRVEHAIRNLAVAVIDDVRAQGAELERSYHAYVRGRLKFLIGVTQCRENQRRGSSHAVSSFRDR